MTSLGRPTEQVAAGGDPERLGEIRAMRAEAVRLTAAGAYQDAASLVTDALRRAGSAAVRRGPASVPWRVETVALLSELAVATLSIGAVERLGEALTQLREVLTDLGPPAGLQQLVGGLCQHHQWTADPSGACMAKPPCPQ
jgi:hypothetical protein